MVIFRSIFPMRSISWDIYLVTDPLVVKMQPMPTMTEKLISQMPSTLCFGYLTAPELVSNFHLSMAAAPTPPMTTWAARFLTLVLSKIHREEMGSIAAKIESIPGTCQVEIGCQGQGGKAEQLTPSLVESAPQPG